MADLNALIAQGPKFHMPDPVAQYAKMQQLQAIQNQNSLAQYNLGSAQRGDMQQNALYARLQDPNFDQANPQHLASLSQFGTPGIQAMKAITEASNARQTGQKLEGENRGLQQREIDQIARNLSQKPDDDSIRASMDIIQKSSFYSPEAKTKALAAFDRALKIPLTERGSYFGMQGATSGELKPTITPQNLGGTSQLVSTPAFGGKATVVPGSVGSNTMTPFQSGSLKVSQQQLGVSQGNLGLAKDKFAWEKANPNKTIKEVEQADGTIQFFGIDNRTGVATPVKLAGAPGPAMPGQGRPAVDGGDVALTGKKRPSATAEKAALQRKQLGLDLDRAIIELTDATKDGGLIDQSTGSGAGRLYDVGAGFFGQAPSGAIAIGKLQPIADMALKMVPRFEGPQSNADTTSYKQAAGQLADPSLPTKIRKEAGKTVLRLMKDRKGQFASTAMEAEGVAPAPAGNAVDASNPLLN